MEQKTPGVWQPALIIAGTSIGGGMLALPIVTSQAGFFPSILLYIPCWFVMMSTALLFLEVCLWMKKETNIISMADATLGKWGKAFSWATYLFLFYCLTVAYVSGGGHLVSEFSNQTLDGIKGPLVFVGIFAPFVYFGTAAVDRINWVLMAGLGVSYLLFVIFGIDELEWHNLSRKNWDYSFVGLPIILLSFGFQGVIPTLTHYMKQDAKKLRCAIVLGSSLPLVVYIIWQALVLGTIPLEGEHGLLATYQQGLSAVHPLRYALESPVVHILGQVFAFCALVTTFFGVTLGLLDFLADGLKIKKTSGGRFFLCSLIFIPPLLLTLKGKALFLIALDIAGGFGGALLLGLLPILMVWSIRYRQSSSTSRQLFGGKPLLILLALFIICEVMYAFYRL